MKTKSAVLASVFSLFALLCMLGGFLLPTIVSGIQDRQILNKISTMDSQAFDFNAQAGMTLIEKLDMIRYVSDAIAIDTGRYFSYETAVEKSLAELKTFLALFAIPWEVTNWLVETCQAQFVLDASNPSNSMIVWSVTLADFSGNLISLVLDDECGKILMLSYNGFSNPVDSLNVDSIYNIDQVAQTIGEYWSLQASPLTADETKDFLQYTIYLTDQVNSTEIYLTLFFNYDSSGFSLG